MKKKKLFKILPKGSIKGYTLIGGIRGTRNLLFKTKTQARGFGGKIRLAYRTPYRRKPILLMGKLIKVKHKTR